MRRIWLVIVLMALLLGEGAAGARSADCVSAVSADDAAAAAQELRYYASALQADVIPAATMGHVLNVLALADALDAAPVLCGGEVVQ